MALARVRRMLLELGYSMKPDAAAGPEGSIGALEVWLHTPLVGMGGISPLQALQTQEGEDLVRTALAQLVGGARSSD